MIQYIPFEEAYEAMLLVAKHSLGLSKESLISETANLLGFKRVGSKIIQSLTKIYHKLIESRIIVTNNGIFEYKK